MEKPQYGRTGLLASRLSGLPVSQPRLRPAGAPPASPSRVLKWYPSLLTVPQQLLDALRREDDGEADVDAAAGKHTFSADPTLITYLRIATISELLVHRLSRASAAPPTRAQVSRVYANVLEWSQAKALADTQPPSSSTSQHGTFFLPSYKLLVMKDEHKVAEHADLTRRSVWLLGKEPLVNDVPLEHPSCSAQHAALEMRFVLTDEAPLADLVAASSLSSSASSASEEELFQELWALLDRQLESANGDASTVWAIELQLIDLASTNRTRLNGEVVPPMEATTVIESDVLEFGYSTRKYVVMRNT